MREVSRNSLLERVKCSKSYNKKLDLSYNIKFEIVNKNIKYLLNSLKIPALLLLALICWNALRKIKEPS